MSAVFRDLMSCNLLDNILEEPVASTFSVEESTTLEKVSEAGKA
jgi:hypothetical protein